MKKTAVFAIILSLLQVFTSCNKPENLTSPDKSLSVEVSVKAGQLGYEIRRQDTVVLEFSKLGISLENKDFSSGLKIKSVSPVSSVSESYIQRTGKRSQCGYTANMRTFSVENAAGDQMDILFLAADNGVAFRYRINEPGTYEAVDITNEYTSFRFNPDTKAWLSPREQPQSGWCRTQPSYETNYQQAVAVGAKSTFGFGWTYPALFQTANAWVLLSETDLTGNFCGTHLGELVRDGEFTVAFPDAVENISGNKKFPETVLPWTSPWRLLIIGKDLPAVVESTLATDLGSKPKEKDYGFVKPGVASWSWALLNDTATNYRTQKEFIDYAAEMNWSYCLIDALWDQQIGYDKIKELADYARSKNVGLWLWYNSGGHWNDAPQTPRAKMQDPEIRKKEMQWLRDTGIKGIKVDFFAGDAQSTIQYYRDIMNDAADYGLMCNFHGATIPRGWSRTFPNLMGVEAVKGFEYITFEQANADLAPNHCCMLPFTRNIIGPMDFTPVCFSEISTTHRITSNAFELALGIIFESGIQHIVETPQGMKNVPDYVRDFMKKLPAAWDETKLLDGYPGKYAVMARKKGNDWYIGVINGQNSPLTLDLDVSFMNKDMLTVIASGADNRSFSIKQTEQNENSKIKIEVSANDGITIY